MLSGIVLAKNEGKNIQRCLKSLDFCDEILVIDDNSTDKTVKVAERLKAKVYTRPLNNDFGGQRNFGLQKARGKWVLFVDADEVVSNKLAKEIKNKLATNDTAIAGPFVANGYFFKRIDFFLGKWLRHGEIGGIRILRLAKKNSGIWKRKVDEIWEIKGKTKVFDNPLLHFSHQELKEFLESISERSTLNARQFFEEKKKMSAIEWLKPLMKFLNNYFLKFGFLDGTNGFVFATLMSFHSFLVRGKLYLMEKNRVSRSCFSSRVNKVE